MEATVSLTDQSGVAEARRITKRLADSFKLSEKRQADAALVVTEAATNILKYAGSGEILLRRFEDQNESGVEIIALDRGNGIINLEMARVDGYSSGGSLGAGMGTIARHTSTFDIYSIPGHGTAVLARIASGELSGKSSGSVSQSSKFDIGFRSTPKQGQEICGDAWSVKYHHSALWIALLDGLGHGPMASMAAMEGIRSFRASGENVLPEDVIRTAHQDMRSTRGAVMAVAKIDSSEQKLVFAGVGNIIAGIRRGGEVSHLLSTDGTVGYNMRTIRQTTTPYRKGNVFIATTDGLSTRWNLNKHPGLLEKPASLIAAVLHRDFGRDSDDATIIVVKAL
jgi:anti-sigma regulatory factor (Ser/Thr protein kinase)